MSSFQLSAGENITEIDLTTVVPSVSTSIAAIAGVFGWGPVGERINIDREPTLVSTFGKPTNLNAETWFSAANFLGYSDNLIVVRAANTTGATPTASFTSTANAINSNNVFTGNSTGIVVGMYVSQTSNATVMAAGNTVTVASVNATTVTLSSNTLSNTAVQLYFAQPATSYTALGLTSGSFVSNLAAQIVANKPAYPLIASFDPDVMYVAKYPGAIGNSLRVAQCDSANQYQSNVSLVDATWTNTSISLAIGSNTATVYVSNSTGGSNSTGNTFATTLLNALTLGDNIVVGNSSIGTQYLSISAITNAVSNSTASTFTVSFVEPYRLAYAYTSNTVIQRSWEFFNVVGVAPGQSQYVAAFGNTSANDELHVVVVDDNGLFTGVPGS
ncbi:MAG: hypothetical protein ACHQU0_03630, partial [Candidatus Paceibacteria bacterium]